MMLTVKVLLDVPRGWTQAQVENDIRQTILARYFGARDPLIETITSKEKPCASSVTCS